MNDHETRQLLERLAETFPEQPAPLPSLLAAARLGQRRRSRQVLTIAAASVALVLGGAAVVQQVVGMLSDSDALPVLEAGPTCPPGQSKQRPEEPSSPVPTGPDYPLNENGLSYGGSSLGDYPEPDLLAVIGDCGSSGYALQTDLQEPAPWSPEAGLEAGTPRTIPVYTSDGVTQIDTFTIGGGEGGVTDPDTTEAGGPGAADIQGEWVVTIVGFQDARGTPAFDTYRDLELSAAFSDNLIRVDDGCRTSTAGFALERGEFAVTSRDEAALPDAETQCKRQAPLMAILDNVRHVTRSGGEVLMHLDNFQIVLVLTPQGR